MLIVLRGVKKKKTKSIKTLPRIHYNAVSRKALKTDQPQGIILCYFCSMNSNLCKRKKKKQQQQQQTNKQTKNERRGLDERLDSYL